MAWAVTRKNVKIHIHNNQGGSVEDYNVCISHKKLKALGAKRRVHKNTNEVFFLIESDYEISL